MSPISSIVGQSPHPKSTGVPCFNCDLHRSFKMRLNNLKPLPPPHCMQIHRTSGDNSWKTQQHPFCANLTPFPQKHWTFLFLVNQHYLLCSRKFCCPFLLLFHLAGCQISLGWSWSCSTAHFVLLPPPLKNKVNSREYAVHKRRRKRLYSLTLSTHPLTQWCFLFGYVPLIQAHL